MEEYPLKQRHTDCVGFMATPPTCLKGVECEFRHSKVAKLNLKVCWYWLAGYCLNPTCAFKHPPLEEYEAALSECPPSSTSANKSNVPCYFYLNGMCNKGDRCSFLHEVDGSASTGKYSNTASAGTETLPSENKALVVKETVSAPTVTNQYRCETTSKTAAASKTTVDTGYQPKQKANSSHLYEDWDEGADEYRSNSSLPAEGSIHSKSPLSNDQSSEEGEDDLIVREERCDSSPGFDVLVDGESENLADKDSPEYFPGLDEERMELYKQWHDFDNPDEYAPMRPGAEILCENQFYDSFDCTQNGYLFGHERSIPGYMEDRMLGSISRKRKPMPIDLAVDDQDGLDLRDHLRRRRVIDGFSSSGFSRMHEALQFIGRSQKWPQRHEMGWQGRLVSEVRNSIQESHREREAFYKKAGTQRRPHRHSQQYRPRKHQDRRPAKPQFPSPAFSRKPVPMGRRSSTENSSAFTGPKSLAEIKEEKKMAKENGGGLRKSGRVKRARVDFQGPKPLNEILKEKRKLADRR